MKKQLLACAIAVGVAGPSSAVVAESRAEPTAQVAYRIVKLIQEEGEESEGTQAAAQGAGAAIGGLIGSTLGPIGTVVGSALGAW